MKKWLAKGALALFTVVFTPFFLLGMIGAMFTDGYKMASWALDKFGDWVVNHGY